MATKTQYAAVLAAIKSAPNSIGVEMIATRSGLTEALVRTIVSALCETRHIKENAERSSTYFTRRPMRDEIDAFLAAQATGLTGISFDEATPSAPVSVSSPTDFARVGARTPQALLGRIFTNPESHEVTSHDMMPHVQTLLDLGLIRKHRDYSNRYFTVREKREAIRKYIAGEISWSTLIGENTDHNPGPVAPVREEPAVSREGVWAKFYLGIGGTDPREYRIDTMDSFSTPSARSREYYYGNYEQTYKDHLYTIFTAPHAVGISRDINAVMRLIKLGFLRIHRDDNSKFFTNPERRADIKRYLNGEITLDQLFGIDPMPVPVYPSAQSLLKAIREASESVAVPECESLNELLGLGLVREHRDKPGFYFTVPAERELIDDYIKGDISWDEVEEFAGQPGLLGDTGSLYPETTSANPDILALAQAVRNLADVIIRANS